MDVVPLLAKSDPASVVAGLVLIFVIVAAGGTRWIANAHANDTRPFWPDWFSAPSRWRESWRAAAPLRARHRERRAAWAASRAEERSAARAIRRAERAKWYRERGVEPGWFAWFRLLPDVDQAVLGFR